MVLMKRRFTNRLLGVACMLLMLCLLSCDGFDEDAEDPPASSHDTTLRVLRFGEGAYSIELKPGVVNYVSDSISHAFAQVAINAVPTSEWAWVTCDDISCNNWFALSDTGTLVTIKVTNMNSVLVYSLRLIWKKFVPPPASDYGVPWASVSYGQLVDPRDQQVYKTVWIGSQHWMAQNLNYVTYGSYAYQNSLDSAAKYGRLYTWMSAMGTVGYDTILPQGDQGICPAGWHIPSDAEWATLSNTVYQEQRWPPLTFLKASVGWPSGQNGSDVYGFRVLPAGEGNPSFRSVGARTGFATSTRWGYLPKIRSLSGTSNYFEEASGQRWNWYSVRCLEN